MKFSEIPGSREIKTKLIRTVKEHRVSHAQLFHGPEESPKLALAVAYAQYINCTGKPGSSARSNGTQADFKVPTDSCGTCPSCLKYQKLVHPDLHFIYPVANTKRITGKPQSKHFAEDWRNFLFQHNFSAGLPEWFNAIGIENKQGIINATDCNEIITTLSYKSYESEYKVMIIWMAEKIFHSAVAKILKILEEPPEKTLFILISDNPGQIIPTILSRTLMVRIPKAESAVLIVNEDDETKFITFRQWMRLCFGKKIKELITLSGEMAKTGREKQKNFLLYSLDIIGQCSTMSYLGKINKATEGEELKFIMDFSRNITPANIMEFNKLFNDALFHVERNAHSGTLFLDLSLKIVRLFHPDFFSPKN